MFTPLSLSLQWFAPLFLMAYCLLSNLQESCSEIGHFCGENVIKSNKDQHKQLGVHSDTLTHNENRGDSTGENHVMRT